MNANARRRGLQLQPGDIHGVHGRQSWDPFEVRVDLLQGLDFRGRERCICHGHKIDVARARLVIAQRNRANQMRPGEAPGQPVVDTGELGGDQRRDIRHAGGKHPGLFGRIFAHATPLASAPSLEHVLGDRHWRVLVV